MVRPAGSATNGTKVPDPAPDADWPVGPAHNASMQTAGVDLAAQAAHTGVCVIEWGDAPRCDELKVGAGDDEIIAAAAASVKCGIDAPFGYPVAFSAFVAGHDAFDPEARPGVDTEPFRLRATDVWVWRQHGRRPLSVSTDLIGVTALRCARLQLMVAAETGEAVDRTGRGRLAEVYPAAALAAWGLDAVGYKRRTEGSRALLADLAGRVVTRFGIELTVAHRRLVETVDDAFDALVAAVIAREIVAGRTQGPPAHLEEAARREGWIHAPRPDPDDTAAAVES